MHYGAYSTDSLMAITNRPDLVFERGEGSWLTDHQGKRYLDFIQGWAVNCLGHCPPEIAAALTAQAGKLLNPSPAFYNAPMIELAGLLTAHSCFDRVFFANTGAEANEGAIKLARKWGQLNRDGAFEIITFGHSFHGRTLATMSASGKAGWDTIFAPQVSGFPKAVYNDIASVEALIGPQTVAVMLEPVQGEGGVIPADIDFLKALRALTEARGILLIVDEVQTGVGRTGKLFAHEWAGITPDVMAIAKGIGGGFPLGACLATAEAASGMVAGTHGSTYGGNPLGIAAAHAVLDVIADEGLMQSARRVGAELLTGLRDLAGRHQVIGDVRGAGLYAAVELVTDRASKTPATAAVDGLVNLMREAGILVGTCGKAGNCVKVRPPLCFTQDDAARFLDVFDRCLAQVDLSGAV